MSGAIEFVNLGSGYVKRMTHRAALYDLEEQGETWIPLSVLSTPTAAETDTDEVVDRVRVEKWFALKNGLEWVD